MKLADSLIACVRSPFLNRAETNAWFQSAGGLPWCSEAWNNNDNAGAISLATSLSSLADNWSGPEAFSRNVAFALYSLTLHEYQSDIGWCFGYPNPNRPRRPVVTVNETGSWTSLYNRQEMDKIKKNTRWRGSGRVWGGVTTTSLRRDWSVWLLRCTVHSRL